jgi:SAM-dependent methyltransferase
VLTSLLAERCDHVEAMDPIADAVAAARQRNRNNSNVSIEAGELAGAWPDGPFDLIVLSEVAYYLDDAELQPTLQRVADALTPGGDLAAVHWQHRVPEYPQAGDAVHATLATIRRLERLARHDERDFLLEVFTRSPGQSVAQREGLC